MLDCIFEGLGFVGMELGDGRSGGGSSFDCGEVRGLGGHPKEGREEGRKEEVDVELNFRIRGIKRSSMQAVVKRQEKAKEDCQILRKLWAQVDLCNELMRQKSSRILVASTFVRERRRSEQATRPTNAII